MVAGAEQSLSVDQIGNGAVLLIVTVALVTKLNIDSEGLQLQRERQVQVETLAAALQSWWADLGHD